jgi:hypothetical protein
MEEDIPPDSMMCSAVPVAACKAGIPVSSFPMGFRVSGAADRLCHVT